MPDGRRTGITTDSSFPSEEEAMSQSGEKSPFTLNDAGSHFGKIGSTVDMNAEKQQNGLTNNGGRRRRRSSSSGDSDLVVLSVVFNKKKQKQNDEVAIAIERLRENGVNCVLFTMNDFRNANRKPESAIDPFRISSLSSEATPSNQSTTRNSSVGLSNAPLQKLDPKLKSPVALMPALPSIKCEISENSNGSTDSSTSSSADIHKSVQKVINSFSPSPSPSPPPLSPQLLTDELDIVVPLNKPLKTEAEGTTLSPSLHQLLSPLLPGPPPPSLQLSVPLRSSCDDKEDAKLQETMIGSSSSVGISTTSEENPRKRRRRRRVRRYYTIRKAPVKKKSTCVNSKATNKLSGLSSTSSTEVIMASSTDDLNQSYLSSPQKFPLDLVVEKGMQESNEVSSTSNVDSVPEVKPKLCVMDQSSNLEDSVQNPDSSSAVIEAEDKKIIINRKRKRTARRKKKRVTKPKRVACITSNDAPCEIPEEKEVETNRKNTESITQDMMPVEANAAEIAQTDDFIDDDDDEDDHIPLASLLERKRAFSPDIIRGVKGISSKLVCSTSNDSNQADDRDQSRHIFSQHLQVRNSVKRSKLEILQCVQTEEEISNNVQASGSNNDNISNSTTSDVDPSTKASSSTTNAPQSPPKRKHRRVRPRFVVRRRRKAAKKVTTASFLHTNAVPQSPEVGENEMNGAEDTEPASIFKEVKQGSNQSPVSSAIISDTDKATVPRIKDEISVGSTDDDSVPSSLDSGIRSSENLSCRDEFKLENEESSTSFTTDSGINADDKTLTALSSEISNSQLDISQADEQLGIFKRADDSLPATPDGMQLRRSNFYSLISDNVRKNMENYLDGRTASKGPLKRRKRTKNSYLLNHGDNCPEDPEAPYRLHMATQVLLKLNRRRAKCKPKEDRGKSLLLYLKLVPKRPPRNGKPVPAATPTEEVKEESEEPLFSGEWSITRRYICHVCGQIENNFWDMVMHKGEQHPGVVVTHTELTGTVPQSLVRTTPAETVPQEEPVPPCSKCRFQFSTTAELHRHIFECAGNASWLETEKVPRKKKSRRRRGFKRRLSNTPKSTPTKPKKAELPKRRPSEVFKCEFCPREFKTEGWLKNHLVTHSLPVSIPLEKLSLPSRASNNSISSRLFK